MCVSELISGMLLSPIQTLKAIVIEKYPRAPLLGTMFGLVCWVSAISALFGGESNNVGVAIFLWLSSITWGIGIWLAAATTFSMGAYLFGVRSRFETFLMTSAAALTPWILLPPLFLFKTSLLGPLGHVFYSLGSYAIWTWTAILFLIALKVTYNLSLERLVVLMVFPLMMTAVGLFWMGGFFLNLFRFL